MSIEWANLSAGDEEVPLTVGAGFQEWGWDREISSAPGARFQLLKLLLSQRDGGAVEVAEASSGPLQSQELATVL